MKVKRVTIYHDAGVFEAEEGVDGMSDVHYLNRDGLVSANFMAEGQRLSRFYPHHCVRDVLTVA